MSKDVNIYKSRYTDGLQAHEKMFTIISHQGNANENQVT